MLWILDSKEYPIISYVVCNEVGASLGSCETVLVYPTGSLREFSCVASILTVMI